MPEEQIKFTLDKVRWERMNPAHMRQGSRVLSCGKVHWKDGRRQAGIELEASSLPDGRYQLHDVQLREERHRIPAKLRRAEIAKPAINVLARVLQTTNMWAGEQSDGAGTIVMNQRHLLGQARSTLLSSYRYGVGDLTPPPWDELWARIESRLEHDPALVVHGFSREEFKRALMKTRTVFPASWVRRRYVDALGDTDMNGVLDREARGWFPAYQLARTATGAICYDPGLSFLAEIGCALVELEGFDGVELLRRQLARSIGMQHHLSLAADLYQRKLLTGLEPHTGGGSARSDILAQVDGRVYEIEMKAFTSSRPDLRLAKEIAEKATKVPREPERPVVVYAVLANGSTGGREVHQLFMEAVDQLAGALPPNISALAAGEVVVDASGGRAKRTLERVRLNRAAVVPSRQEDLDILFTSQHSEILRPAFGVMSFLAYERPAGEPQTAT